MSCFWRSFVLDNTLANDELTPAELEMTPKASEAFSAYYGLGRSRSLEKLAAAGGEGGVKVGQLEKWSTRYGWQERLKRIAQTDLERANELRRDIYFRTLGLYDQKTQETNIGKLSLSDVHGIHDRVRPAESGSVAVGVGATVVVVIGERLDGPQ